MTSIIKVNNLQNQCGANTINKCGTAITVGASGDTINLASGATQTGFGRTGTVDWVTTPKTATFTAVSGEGYFCNTTSTAFTVNLPASPSAGDIVSLKDYAFTFATNNLTVARNGSPIGGGTGDSPVYNVNGTALTFIYVDGTQGWLVTNESTDTSAAITNTLITATGGTIATCGDYKIHTFTSPGTFCVSAGAGPVAVADYLVVAGGGGASYDSGGGGGAGGFRASSGTYTVGCSPASPLISCVSSLPISVQGYPITVGGGGASSSSMPVSGTSGSNSTGVGITSTGGGGGGRCSGGLPGGSGGGLGGTSGSAGGSGNTPAVSPSQGQPGGIGSGCPSASGGGGAIVAGESKSPIYGCVGGDGGNGAGVPTAFGTSGESSGSYYYFSGGGGGGPRGTCWCVPGLGGLGGGGDSVNSGAGNAGTANTGGGAGGPSGSSTAQAGAGGSGIVIIRYKFQ